MTRITDFSCTDQLGGSIPCDAYGNNVALRCPKCGHLILAIARPGQRGSDTEHPALCRSCRSPWWVQIDEANQRLYLHLIQP